MNVNKLHIDYHRLARDVSERRYYDRYSLRELSAVTGIATSTLSRVENGRMVDLSTYIVMCRYVNRPFNHYFTFTN